MNKLGEVGLLAQVKLTVVSWVTPFQSPWACARGPMEKVYEWIFNDDSIWLACSVAQFCSTLCDPMDRSLEVYSSLFMGFSWQEYWSGLLFPPPRDHPNPGIEPVFSASPVLQILYHWATWEAQDPWSPNQGPYHQGHHSLYMESHLHKYLSSWTLNPASIHTK